MPRRERRGGGDPLGGPALRRQARLEERQQGRRGHANSALVRRQRQSMQESSRLPAVRAPPVAPVAKVSKISLVDANGKRLSLAERTRLEQQAKMRGPPPPEAPMDEEMRDLIELTELNGTGVLPNPEFWGVMVHAGHIGPVGLERLRTHSPEPLPPPPPPLPEPPPPPPPPDFSMSAAKFLLGAVDAAVDFEDLPDLDSDGEFEPPQLGLELPPQRPRMPVNSWLPDPPGWLAAPSNVPDFEMWWQSGPGTAVGRCGTPDLPAVAGPPRRPGSAGRFAPTADARWATPPAPPPRLPLPLLHRLTRCSPNGCSETFFDLYGEQRRLWSDEGQPLTQLELLEPLAPPPVRSPHTYLAVATTLAVTTAMVAVATAMVVTVVATLQTSDHLLVSGRNRVCRGRPRGTDQAARGQPSCKPVVRRTVLRCRCC